ncbi:MAG: ATP-binding cassette domain-containing protein [Oscillospiraceae bacterium]|nr:ATP-binding cassette domain-containing protein [Oscillospiraceae bacterium]
MADNLLEVKNLKKYFNTPRGPLHAVDDITFTIERGHTLGVVGESGCGKSTLGRTIIGLLESTQGEIRFEGLDITHPDMKRKKELCKEMQMVFQDPFSSLNPRRCVAELIAEPLKIFKVYKFAKERDERVFELMDVVGLDRRFATSYPHELDGGRRQRIGIARALAMDPKFIVCDEPVSALDVSIQAQVLNLLQDLQDERGLTYIIITHDLSVVRHISDEIMVMYLGCMVEKCDAKELFVHTLHPYTKGLLSAIPIPTVKEKKPPVLLEGELTSPINPKPVCRFANRCKYCTEQCLQSAPALEEVLPGHFVACHHVREINGL